VGFSVISRFWAATYILTVICTEITGHGLERHVCKCFFSKKRKF